LSLFTAAFRVAIVLAAVWFTTPPAHAQDSAEPAQLEVRRDEQGAVVLDFSLRPTLSRPVQEALQRGIPLYFVADVRIYRERWYWRDERVARATKSWRLSYQPLTASWRVSQGGLQQSYPTLEEALLPITRNARWKIADAPQIDPDDRHHVEFSWRLDTSQLPRPLQIGIGGQADWQLAVERTLPLD
jgi:hypothetical protein